MKLPSLAGRRAKGQPLNCEYYGDGGPVAAVFDTKT